MRVVVLLVVLVSTAFAEPRRPPPKPDRLAVVLLFDRSSSNQPPRIEGFKEAAQLIAGVLEDRDLVSVVAFDTGPEVIVPMQPAAGRKQIWRQLQKLKAQGRTSYVPALATARKQLAGVAARAKHILLVSDGGGSSEGIEAVMEELAKGGVALSVIGFGRDRETLQRLADVADGRFYQVEDIGELFRIGKLEVKQLGEGIGR